MAIYCYITENCRQDAQTHGWQDRLESFSRDIEAKQTVRMFDHFPPPYLVKKKFGEYAGRLIAAHMPIGEDSVVVLLSAMIRGSGDYEAFSADAVKYGQSHLEEHYLDVDWASFIETRKHKDPPPPKPRIGTEEYGYLHDVLHHAASANEDPDAPEDGLVAESAEWVRRSTDAAYQNYHAFFYKAITSATDHDMPGGLVVPVESKPGYSLLIRNFPQHRLLWLVAPVIDADTKELTRIRQTYASVLNAESPSLEDVLRASRRAYPAVLLADDNLWMNLQKETQANMALSPEESKVLRSARRTVAPGGTINGGFPMFINGRAGSGKTTILQYLFTEFLFYHIKQGSAIATPIYFTCNPELLRNSREFVVRLIQSGANWWHYEGDREQLLANNKGIFDAAFKEFHRHLLSLVAPEQRAKRFPPDKFIGYARFKQLWNHRFGQSPQAKREFGPDISWHVIRSYIKGLTSDDYLIPDEYRHLDKKQITVTQQTYERVFQNVWNNWYKPLSDTDQFWDHQDLARFLIEADDARREEDRAGNPESAHSFGLRPIHPVIFCDESQDFTRIELEVILRMSLFAERSLDREEIPLVPFVFAGDQFQTLNPTGFRWEAIKAFFVEKFILALATHRPKGIDLNYKELTYNYRSSRSIVRFSNYVQALRARLFDLTTLRPQQPWEHEQNPPPVTYFLRDNDDFWAQLKKQSDVVIIVPCGEGEELSFVRQDTVLKSKVNPKDDGSFDVPVVSAVGAKGLEFPRVVVYGFGDTADATLLGMLKGDSLDSSLDPDRTLPLQYFINRLYVAVSRAKRRMFIVDSSDGFRKLWDFAQNDTYEKTILGGFKKDRREWEESIERLQPGRANDLTLDRAPDPLEIAHSLASDGRARGYAPHLLQAANIFKNNGQLVEAVRCKAEAARVEGKLIDAAQMFLECNETDTATDCFWRAEKKGWKRLCEAGESFPDVMSRLEYGFARAIEGKPSLREGADLLDRLDTLVSDTKGRDLLVGSSAWSVALRALLDNLLSSITAQPEDWLRISNLVESLVQSGIRVSPAPRAQIAYKAHELALAVELWDSASEKGSQEYRIAKAFTSPYPEKLIALFELGKFQEITTEHKGHPELALSKDQLRVVGRAYVRERDYETAFPLLIDAHDLIGLGDLVSQTYSLHPELCLRAGVASFAVASLSNDWAMVLPYVNQTMLPHVEKSDAKLKEWSLENKDKFDVALMRVAARSDSLRNLAWESKRDTVTQRPFAEYFQRAYLRKGKVAIAPEFVEELGAAIERSGRRVDALQFYENVQSEQSLSEDLRQHAQERWIACKERQARFLLQDGDKKGADSALSEAKKVRQRIGMTAEDKVEEYPALESGEKYLVHIRNGIVTLSSKAATVPMPIVNVEPEKISFENHNASDQVKKITGEPPEVTSVSPRKGREWVLFGLTFKFYPDSGKLNIEDGQGSTASVRAGKATCTSEDVVISEFKPRVFEISEWDLTINMTQSDRVSLDFVGCVWCAQRPAGTAGPYPPSAFAILEGNLTRI